MIASCYITFLSKNLLFNNNNNNKKISRFDVLAEPNQTDCQKKILKLLESEKNCLISKTLNGSAFCVNVDGKELLFRGLKERLKERLWPNTEENPLKRQRNDAKIRSSTKFYQNKKGMAIGCKTYGSSHGELVHKELELFSSYLSKRKTAEQLQNSLQDPDPCTARIVNMLEKEHFFPVASEFMIWEKNWRVATAIDMIAYNYKQDKMVLLEFKTGYENEEYGPHHSDSVLPKPFSDLINCPQIRHQLQLFAMVQMLLHNYDIHADSYYIIRACPKSNSTEKFGLCYWFQDTENQQNFNQMMLDGERL